MVSRRAKAVVTSAVLVVSGVVAGAAPAGATPASVSCTEAGVTWRVDHERLDTAYGPAVQVTGLKKTQGGNETDASGLTWELRYDYLVGADGRGEVCSPLMTRKDESPLSA